MKKISVISPILDQVNRISETMKGILELFKDKYDFEVLYYYCGKLPSDLPEDSSFQFIETKPDTSFDDCVTMGFEKAIGDCVVVADLNNLNYKDYLTKLILEWEANAQIVLVKQEKKLDTFWKKVGNFFVNIKNKMYDLIIGLSNLNKDFKAYKTFQLFTREVADVIKEFPQKNYYLRNFDCWIDFRVSVLTSKEPEKNYKKIKVFDDEFIGFLCFSTIFIGILLLVCLSSKLVNVGSRSLYILIGIGLMVASLVFGIYNLHKWFLHRTTRLFANTNK